MQNETPVFDGQELTGNVSSFDSARVKLIDNIQFNLDKRFESKKDVIAATSIGKLTNYPNKLASQPGSA